MKPTPTVTHLTVNGPAQSACGIKNPLPYVNVRHAQAHVDGYSLPVCEACQIATGGVRWPTGDEQASLFGESA